MRVRCINNGDGYYAVSLEVGRDYEVVIDWTLEPDAIRVTDESGEDYIYPREWFEVKS